MPSRAGGSVTYLTTPSRPKVITLDADMMAVANPDELFQLPCPAGICSGKALTALARAAARALT
jgi:hypothetical protein